MKKNLNQFAIPPMTSSLEANWWVFALRGGLALILGIVAFFIPEVAVVALTLVFGIYALIDGIFDIVSGVNQARRGRQWGSLLFSGILSILVGMLVLILPQIAVIGFTAFLWTAVAIWAIATGSLEIAAAIRLRKEIKGEWLMALSGVFTMLLGIAAFMLFWVSPVASMLSIGVLIGAYAVIHGVVLLMLAYKLRKREKSQILHHETDRTVSI